MKSILVIFLFPFAAIAQKRESWMDLPEEQWPQMALTNHVQDAIGVLKYNVENDPAFYVNYNLLAKAYLQSGNKGEAIKYYRLSTEKLGDKEKNEAFAELEKLKK